MSTKFHETAKDHIIIVAHRGVAGGNIPCNTRASYEIALKQGADMLETDVSRTGDGTLVIFHPKMERIHLRTDKNIPESTDEEVAQMRFCNYDSSPTQFGLMRFDEILDAYNGRCYLNIDKFWDEWQHPIWRRFYEEGVHGGHGGMDWLVFDAYFTSLRDNMVPPIDTYDTAAWMSIAPLSEISIANGSMPVDVPDFTRGMWTHRTDKNTGFYALDK